MKRTAAVAVAAVALSLASAGSAVAGGGATPPAGDLGCGGGYVADALSTHLKYRPAHWDTGSGDGTLTTSAPRGWSFVRTTEGEGRFHDRSGNDLLSLGTTAGGDTPAAQMADQVRALAGTSGLKVLGQHTKTVAGLHQRWSTLSYSYRSSMSEPRLVKVRWIAFGTDPSAEASLVLTVAGRPLDGPGLDALLGFIAPTVRLVG